MDLDKHAAQFPVRDCKNNGVTPIKEST